MPMIASPIGSGERYAPDPAVLAAIIAAFEVCWPRRQVQAPPEVRRSDQGGPGQASWRFSGRSWVTAGASWTGGSPDRWPPPPAR